jgi:hypothetical protein
MKINLFPWKPFNYICIDFNDKEEVVGGFFPKDVRNNCSFNIKEIKGPIVTNFKSWIMHQIVN